MAITRNFSENLEKDFEKLTTAIGERHLMEKAPLPEKEIVKKSFGIFVPPPAPAPAAAASQTEEKSESPFLPQYLQDDGAEPEVEKKIESLIDLALAKGLAEACNAARREKPFVMDAFHDALADKLIPELKKRGVIKD